jgi:hypothetical protein
MSDQTTQDSTMTEEVGDVDSLYDSAMSSGDTRGGIVDEQQAAPVDPEFEINYKGEAKKLPLSKLRDLAQQGFDYSQKMSEFNKLKAKYDSQEKEFNDRYKRFSEMDRYIAENPDWWNHVNQAWTSRDMQQANQMGVAPSTAQQLTNDPAVMEQFEALKNEIQGLKSFKDSVETERAQAQRAQEDRKYEEELTSLQKQYPTVDFNKPDETGNTLEYNVLKHANENGIKSFKTAFLDFYHDNLMKIAEMKAKETFAKDSQQIKKLGISTQQPQMKRQGPSRPVSQMSYEDLTKEALAELGL